MPKTSGCLIRASLCVLSLCAIAPAKQISNDQPDIAAILRSAGAYCEKVKGIALYYVAKEKIEQIGYSARDTTQKSLASGQTVASNLPGQVSELTSLNKISYRETRKRTLTYDYQLVRQNGQFEEKRTLIEEDGEMKHVENAHLDTRFKATNLVFGPVGFLSRYWQQYFQYEFIGRERLDDKACVVLKASPGQPMAENNNIARIWVDEKDCSVLRIEWEPQSLGYQEIRSMGSSGVKKQTMICRVEYGIEKSGVRFPSRLVSQEVLVGSQIDDRKVLAQTTYTYSDYRFFTVGVEVKY